jgi:hypothetical protein
MLLLPISALVFHNDNETKDYIAGLAKQYKIDIVCGTLVEKVPHETSSNAREHKTFNTFANL